MIVQDAQSFEPREECKTLKIDKHDITCDTVGKGFVHLYTFINGKRRIIANGTKQTNSTLTKRTGSRGHFLQQLNYRIYDPRQKDSGTYVCGLTTVLGITWSMNITYKAPGKDGIICLSSQVDVFLNF